MTRSPDSSCLLYSNNPEWTARLTALLDNQTVVHPFDSPVKIRRELERQPYRLLLLDLLTRDARDLLATIIQDYPQALIIAFGVAGSDPMLQAREWDIFATETEPVDRHHLGTLVRRALRQAELACENRLLRQENIRLTTLADVIRNQPQMEPDASLDIRDLSAAMRHFTHVESLLQRLVDEVADALRVSRIGIFSRTRDIASYRLRAGLRCLEPSISLEFNEAHPYTTWITLHSHAVARSRLDLIQDLSARLMLTDMLDQFGAEVLIPLQSHHRLLGWLFVGPLANGLPFEKRHLDQLISLTECVSTTLENALLYEEATIQRALAETLLHSLPSGIVAVDDSGIVRWYNESAQSQFGVTVSAAISRPIEGLSSHLADLLRRTLGPGGGPQAGEWVERTTGRTLAVHTQPLTSQTHCLGALAVVQDTTEEKFMQEKQDRIDRATFWTELAASLSHEVRNPLVAIKTFAQLLPERYGDQEFQHEFKDLVSAEIERLNGIVDQIHTFAHPPPLEFKPLSLKRCLEISQTRLFPTPRPGLRVTLAAPDDLPQIAGDQRALGEAFDHLLANASEALTNSPHGEIAITLMQAPSAPATQLITIKDNGPGVPAALADKLFSPFTTTKARGLGLGLPIARRIILDHGGTITVHSNAQGVLATIQLPMASTAAKGIP